MTAAASRPQEPASSHAWASSHTSSVAANASAQQLVSANLAVHTQVKREGGAREEKAERRQEGRGSPTPARKQRRRGSRGGQPPYGARPPVAEDPCQCGGNCGHPDCKANQNAISRHEADVAICTHPKVPGFSRCWRCKCAKDECDGARLVTFQRLWCRKCHALAEPGSGMYSNRFGVWKFARNWGNPLRVVAKFACVWQLCTPPDCTSVAIFSEENLGVQPGSLVQPVELIWLSLVFAIKWPPMINEIGARFDEDPAPPQGYEGAQPPPHGDQPPWHERVTKQTLCDLLIALLQAADGPAMQEHSVINLKWRCIPQRTHPTFVAPTCLAPHFPMNLIW